TAVIVRAAPVEKGTIRRDISLTGDVEAMISVQVFPKCPGRLISPTERDLQTIRDLHAEGAISSQPPDRIEDVEESDSVKKGQIIAVIDHENLEAQVNQAKAALTTANAQLKQAEVARAQTEKDLQRLRNLYEEGATSKQSLDKIETECQSLVQQENVAKARVEQSQAGLNQAQIQLSECFISAPISGIISEKYLERGDMAMVTRPIFAIIDVDKVKVTADLSERYLGQVAKGAGASIKVDTFAGRSFRGTVTRISPTLNVINRTAKLEITVDNPNHDLKPGMFARVTLNVVKREGVPIVLEAVVLRDQSGEYVFVVEEDIARRREVKLGLQEGPRVEILDGLQPGEVLIVSGQQKVAEGQRVQILK
ncbi:efflux RND transporter periplasmic adaptor subunit, partial [bacterium]|nr:efflux RND transporter periplasmic adaptor subunit [bacterium]